MNAAMMFVPSTLGLLVMVSLLYLHFRENLPRTINTAPVGPSEHPILGHHPHHYPPHLPGHLHKAFEKWAAAPLSEAVSAQPSFLQRLSDPKEKNKFVRNIFLFLFHSAFIMGILVSLMSNLFNNHPALMIGTLTLTKMHLAPLALKISYLSTVIGSDMGSLLLPMGTLATLMWMHICRKGKVKISWSRYIRTTIVVIPVTIAFTWTVLYFWVSTLL
ncbi:MAG: hypothetical protein K6T81_10695 [Alicyclobacillus macrosporangiidus]|nr:hypothetical protein [Alicyclobacillus macrosporangiidus]